MHNNAVARDDLDLQQRVEAMFSTADKIPYRIALPMRLQLATQLRSGLVGNQHALPSIPPLHDITPQQLAKASSSMLDGIVRQTTQAFRYLAAWLEARVEDLGEYRCGIEAYYKQLI